jgi:hypothetical protein
MHAGLRFEARDHSADMAANQKVGHDGFEDRLREATPDPLETAGGSDDGIWGVSVRACENALFRYRAGSTQETDEQVARALAAQWAASAPHAACMFDGRMNAAGLGIFRDVRGAWWATLEVVTDATPPAGPTRCGTDVPGATLNLC